MARSILDPYANPMNKLYSNNRYRNQMELAFQKFHISFFIITINTKPVFHRAVTNGYFHFYFPSNVIEIIAFFRYNYMHYFVETSDNEIHLIQVNIFQ